MELASIPEPLPLQQSLSQARKQSASLQGPLAQAFRRCQGGTLIADVCRKIRVRECVRGHKSSSRNRRRDVTASSALPEPVRGESFACVKSHSSPGSEQLLWGIDTSVWASFVTNLVYEKHVVGGVLLGDALPV